MCLGYGQTGPQSQSPGYDSIASAVSGMMHITGPEVSVFDGTSGQRNTAEVEWLHIHNACCVLVNRVVTRCVQA